jgi:hypothetical protein
VITADSSYLLGHNMVVPLSYDEIDLDSPWVRFPILY